MADQHKSEPVTVVINNSNNNTNDNGGFAVLVPLKSKGVAFLLCLILGYLGAHHFYAGKMGMGILYLLTAGLCGIGWIIDCIRILVGAYSDKYGRKLV